MSGQGHGQPCDTFVVETQQHRDHGYIALQCDTCNATWVGPTGEPCPWCETSLTNMRRWQAELVLTPPDTDCDDLRRPAAMEAWQQRLATAISADLITRRQAELAWDRAERPCGNVNDPTD